MTALDTVAGHPAAGVCASVGSQMLQPLAIAVIGGGLISMVLSLIVIPTVFFYLGKKQLAIGK